MEPEGKLVCEVRETTMDDIAALRHVQGEAWLVTYPSPENGVSMEWVQDQVNSRFFSNEGLIRSKEFISEVLADSSQIHRVALLGSEVVGFAHASTCDDGAKELKAVYVSPKVFGKGIGAQLMEAVDHWVAGVETWVTVAKYNKRAIRFYEKNGFNIVSGSESVYREKLPVIDMVRKGSES